MRKFLAAATMLGCICLATSGAFAGQVEPQSRARELAASFSKSKHEVKEKRGVRVEKFKDVRSDPVFKADARGYSGTYEADFGCALTITVRADGRADASGSEPTSDLARPRRFTLRDARVAGALLTGTKVYDDGATEEFEGVFINRTERNSPTDAGTTTFGLGIVFDPPKTGESFVMTRLFYAVKR
ncbi:MAG: hypothetical protein QOC99_1620 [Acidobacteriota bacterium]|nr:hypothetical protein [Acidobacteriota bacterium]